MIKFSNTVILLLLIVLILCACDSEFSTSTSAVKTSSSSTQSSSMSSAEISTSSQSPFGETGRPPLPAHAVQESFPLDSESVKLIVENNTKYPLRFNPACRFWREENGKYIALDVSSAAVDPLAPPSSDAEIKTSGAPDGTIIPAGESGEISVDLTGLTSKVTGKYKFTQLCTLLLEEKNSESSAKEVGGGSDGICTEITAEFTLN